MSLDPHDIALVLMKWVILVCSLSFHEFGHAWAAFNLGDPTAKLKGRLTLNPIAHSDLIGTVLLPLYGLFNPGAFFIGWAKPVPVTPQNFKNPGKDGILVAIAGPGANLVICLFTLVGLIALGLAGANGMPDSIFQTLLSGFKFIFWLNFFLAIFNLIPIPPLDGSWILRAFLPESFLGTYNAFSRVGFIVILLGVYKFGNIYFGGARSNLFGLFHFVGLNHLARMIS